MNTAEILSALSLPAQQDTVSAWLDKHAPAFTEKAVNLAKPPFHYTEILELVAVVSAAGQELKGAMSGADVKTVVKAVVRYLFNQHLRPLLPPLAAAFIRDETLDGIVDYVYVTAVKALKK